MSLKNHVREGGRLEGMCALRGIYKRCEIIWLCNRYYNTSLYCGHCLFLWCGSAWRLLGEFLWRYLIFGYVTNLSWEAEFRVFYRFICWGGDH